jgi:hypothetical protein
MRAVPYRILIALSAASLLWSPVARAADDDDLVLLVNGGRLRGVVIEEDPQKGVRIKLVDGQIRSLKPSEVREVQYHGASAPAAAAAAPAATFAPSPAPTPAPAPAAASAPAPYQPNYAAPVPYPPPASASAPAPAHHAGKFELGIRLGFAIPMGDYTGAGSTTDSSGVMTTYTSTAMSDGVSLKIPVLLELGYEVAPGLVLGLYVQPGIILDKTSDQGCPSGATCSDQTSSLACKGSIISHAAKLPTLGSVWVSAMKSRAIRFRAQT